MSFIYKNDSKSVFGLIGRNIKYSFSKKFFSDKFIKDSIHNSVYKIYDISTIEKVIMIFDNPYLKGCNVTIPYKISIIPFLNEIDPIAKNIGSINVIKINNKYKIGYNTDILGFEISLINYLHENLYLFGTKMNMNALILGTGGVSKTISYVLNKFKISYKYVSRIKKKKCNYILSYEEINKDVLKTYKIIINCTPVGTYPNINLCPNIPYEYLSEEHYLYDLVYNPEKTLFLKKGEERGTKIKNGLEMLYIQAEESWKIWNS
ncbi:shikimate dehydrogenase family protein [Blattabacterium cuenoti]|uniref:shikimate dehydrogenase family protein n=1 Tax=Blattabacterium cuenoti TaxID=1653831 RepID=UPI00163C9C67|nr:shikimate dehydrogenase [Blattabacterium cuenoti]